MRNNNSNIILVLLCVFAVWASPAAAQSPYYEEADTTKQDTVQQDSEEPVLAAPAEAPTEVLVNRAVTWCRRMLLRGFADFSTTGDWATYAETGWNKAAGSYGPVRAHFTVNYLGPTSWIGSSAEHLQFVYRTLESPKVTIEIDAVVGGGEKIDTIHRLLYRVDKGELTTADVRIPEGQLDYDKMDKPKPGEQVELKLYSGTWEATIYQGSGSNAAKVYAYRVAELPPLSLVVLGYGEEALTYKSGGDGAEPRFEAPSPTTR